LRPFVASVLRQYDRILAREETDRQRFIAIGAPAAVVETSGNVKFDYIPDDRPLEIAPELAALIAGRKVLVLGSTMEGEDEALIPELGRFIAGHDAFVIIAPRKPERFDVVANLLATANIRFVRRTNLNDSAADVLLLDTFGELARVYRFATAAFIGGSVVRTGGHNPIEPAADGVPVSFGPHMSNFREIARVFLRDGGAVEARDAAAVFTFAAKMFDDAPAQRAMSERARRTVEQNRGAAARTAARIVELLA
jgi:3-deoxy-D-manno-octulosonic-acid transferase